MLAGCVSLMLGRVRVKLEKRILPEVKLCKIDLI